MKILARSISSLLIFTLFFSLKSFAWNSVGHMVIADIAYQRLTPEVREKVDNMVSHIHNEYPGMGTFQILATWPDRLRSQRVETYTHWHYIDYGISLDGTPLKDVIDTDNAVWAINHIKAVVQYAQANPYERARFTAFLIHIVGDIHQPLHTVTAFTAKTPSGDKGGNLYTIQHKNSKMNIHKLWDDGVDLFSGSDSINHIDELAKEITSKYPEAYFGKQAEDLNVKTWTDEGMVNAKTYVYNTPQNVEPSTEYLELGKQTVQRQVALAGYRLAALLNRLLASHH